MKMKFIYVILAALLIGSQMTLSAQNNEDNKEKKQRPTPEQVAQKRTTNGLVIGGVVLVMFIGLVALIKRRKSK